MIKALPSASLWGIIFVLIAALCWGTLGPSAKFAMHVDPVILGLLRAFVGGLCFLAHALITKQYAIKKKDVPAFVVFSILGVACFFAVYQAAIPRIGAGMASILLYTAPAWVALLSAIFLGEKITGLKVLCLVLCMIGAGLTCISSINGAGLDVLGILFGLASGLAYSLHYIFGKTYLKDYSPITLYAWVLPLGSFFLFCYQGFPNIIETLTTSREALGVALWHGVITTYAAYFFYCQGLKRLEATKVSLIATMEPIFAVFLAWLLWNENFGLLGYCGAALVLLGVVLSSLKSNA